MPLCATTVQEYTLHKTRHVIRIIAWADEFGDPTPHAANYYAGHGCCQA